MIDTRDLQLIQLVMYIACFNDAGMGSETQSGIHAPRELASTLTWHHFKTRNLPVRNNVE